MKAVRSRTVLSDHESCIMSDDGHHGYGNKKRKRVSQAIHAVSPTFSVFISEAKMNPKKACKRVVFKLILLIWCTAIIYALFSLLGFSKVLGKYKSDLSKPQTDIDQEDDSSGIFPTFLLNPFQAFDPSETKSMEINQDEEELLIQHVVVPQKAGNKINKKLEKQLACEEVACINTCNQKIKPRCAKSKSCRTDRDKICHRRCRKARCEERCKDEPSFGYVEREQRMEKCKESCTGPTAVHNKCIKKCHSQFKPCKARCYEIASKFQCETPPISPNQITATESPDSSLMSKKINSLNARTLELLENPDMI